MAKVVCPTCGEVTNSDLEFCPTCHSSLAPVEPRRHRGVGLLSVIAVIAFVVFTGRQYLFGSSGSKGLPVCDSPEAQQAVKDLPKGLSMRDVAGPRIEQLRDVRAGIWDEAAKLQYCRATAFTEAGSQGIVYGIHWVDRNAGTWAVQIVPDYSPQP